MTVTEIQPIIMRQSDPIADVVGAHAENVAHDVELELVEVAVDAGAQEGLELVGARFDLVPVGILGDG